MDACAEPELQLTVSLRQQVHMPQTLSAHFNLVIMCIAIEFSTCSQSEQPLRSGAEKYDYGFDELVLRRRELHGRSPSTAATTTRTRTVRVLSTIHQIPHEVQEVGLDSTFQAHAQVLLTGCRAPEDQGQLLQAH
jgi:hypothetical protein